MIALPPAFIRRILAALIAADARAEHAERELADLRAAYEALMHENKCQAHDLDTWNMCTGWALADKAEGREQS